MDADLEKAIDEAGREAVFDAAEDAGWHPRGSSPPQWVWWMIVEKVRKSKEQK